MRHYYLTAHENRGQRAGFRHISAASAPTIARILMSRPQPAQLPSRPTWPFPGVDPEMFRRVSREHRSPPLTPTQQRRADAISFDDTPRETLAAAWAGASEQDRRDLIERATGRVI